ncbi:rho guanine nucleotide exchange factor 39 isoform X3 [Physeter macrocephalus]|uniref:Rho guanine nucleotide exchange factor 39 isoform X3 n=1 Tax=Physeter macrocephalus TaxID=9755 RepID=A0A9W2WJ36_PHYMC|nr:rho guanine nucleotide exchange factor 39 isoform X3 [Physeter catodon]
MGLVALRHVGSSQTRARTHVPCIGRRILNRLPWPLFPLALGESCGQSMVCLTCSVGHLVPRESVVSKCPHCVLLSFALFFLKRELLPYLEGGRWGQGLEGFCPHLELYTQFAANAERSRTTLQEQLKKNKRFRRFVRLQEGRPEFGGLQLQDLLPLPLQRLQQYENLAIALAENTGPNSPDHEQLTRAARRISDTAQRVHTISQKQKNDQHLQRVQALLSGRQAKGLISGRWFLRQGWLLVVPPRGEPRPRMFFLFSDALLMAKPRPPLHLLQSGTFACQALYPMAECQLHRVFGHSGGPCGGLLSQPEEQEESYKFESRIPQG